MAELVKAGKVRFIAQGTGGHIGPRPDLRKQIVHMHNRHLQMHSSDFDGDGRADTAVWRPSDGKWHIRSATGAITVAQWGLLGQWGDIPLAVLHQHLFIGLYHHEALLALEVELEGLARAAPEQGPHGDVGPDVRVQVARPGHGGVRVRGDRPVVPHALGVPYELGKLDLARQENSTPAYLAVHPLGELPALLDGDVTLLESLAICLHLADRFPEKHLAPRVGSTERGP